MIPVPNSIAALAPEITEWRRDLHRHPETNYEEYRTAGVVADKLKAWGLDAVETGIGQTGVVGVLHGRSGPGGEAILLRADMDALPMQEEGDHEHASTIADKMHACGHDGHTAMLLGAAKHLADTRNFDGTVYFCFQPAEEGGAGAKAMLEDGLLDRFPAKAVYGMHNRPGLPLGQFAVRPGPVMASADEFIVTVTGKGGHAAKPHLSRDPVLAGAHLVTALQSIVSRRVDPFQPAVLSICVFQAGTASNVIPDEAVLKGTIRTFDEGVYAMIRKEAERICADAGKAFGVEVSFRINGTPYPPTVNDPDRTAFVTSVLEELVGAENLVHDEYPTMGGEDFAFMANARPGAFINIGNGDSSGLHTTTYDFNDEAAPFGVAYWAKLVELALPAS
ncbi:MAG: M20 aminoacylase family protein [Paracoccaceae bacterium]